MKSGTTKILSKIAWVILLFAAIVLGFKNLREPDIWWQLRTGEWIIQHHAVPFKDIFSFTYEGTPWINVKWGFEVLMQCMAYIGGPEFTPVLQCIANVLILIFVMKVYKLLRLNRDGLRMTYPSAAILFSSIILLFICSFRFIGRPEMASHVMTAVFLFFILKNYKTASRNIYWLIPLEAVWANLHEAYGTGTVMVIAAAIATWLQYYLQSRKIMEIKKAAHSNTKAKKTEAPSPTLLSEKQKLPIALSITAIGAILAPAIHPYGLLMITHPLEIFSQVCSNKFTSELLGYTDPLYWHWESYANVVLFGFGVAFLFLKTLVSKGIKWIFRPVKSYGLPYIALYFLFFYLSLTAYRNIPFFVIVAIPLFSNGLDIVYDHLQKRFPALGKQGLAMFAYGVLILMSAGFYVSITTGKFYKVCEEGHDNYGLKINAFANPVGSANYVREHHLKGNCFTDFLVSSYLLWDLQPDFKTFIDLRDLDVFPPEFFEHLNLLSAQPQLFANIDKVAHFKYAVILRREFGAVHQYLASNPNWRAVYADPVSAVYIKKDSTNPELMSLFNTAPPDVPFHAPAIPPNSKIAAVVSQIFWPVYNSKQEATVDIDLLAADYYQSIGHLDAALSSAKKSAQNNIANWDGEDMLGNIYLNMAEKDTIKTNKQNDHTLATAAFNRAVDENKKDDAAYIGLGTMSLNTGDVESAESWFKQAEKYNPKNYLVYWNLANCERSFYKEDASNGMMYRKQRLKYLEKAYSLNQDQRIRFYLGMAYGQTNDCDNCRKYLDQNTLRYPGIPQTDKKLAKEIAAECGRN